MENDEEGMETPNRLREHLKDEEGYLIWWVQGYTRCKL